MRWLIPLLFLVLASSKLAESKKMGKIAPLFSEQSSRADEEAVSDEKFNSRKGKVFSLFNIVQFKNSGCRSQSSQSPSGTGATTRNGTCYTSSECTSKGGTASGNCAAGFGVCCVFFISASGTTIFQNCTYIRNPGYPAAFTGNGGTVTYTIKKCAQNVCFLRLDFESFTIQGTGATTEINGGKCLDTFAVALNTAQQVPQICGQNTGQHLYLDVGNSATDTATLTFTFMGNPTNTTTARIWEIKVTQLPCYGTGSGALTYVPPPGCLQYVTGLTGRISTFNFIPTNDNHLANQNYRVCIRQESGFCCVQYQTCSDTNSFTLDTQAAIAITALVDNNCFIMASKDYIEIPGGMGSCVQGNSLVPQVTRFCGGVFSTFEAATISSSVCTCLEPFIVSIVTNSVSDVAANAVNVARSRGLCLTYTQIPCAS